MQKPATPNPPPESPAKPQASPSTQHCSLVAAAVGQLLTDNLRRLANDEALRREIDKLLV